MKIRVQLSRLPLGSCRTFDFIIIHTIINEVIMKVMPTLGCSQRALNTFFQVFQNSSDVIIIDIAGV